MQFKNSPQITKKVAELNKFIGSNQNINEVLECIKIDALQGSLTLTATNGNGNFYKSVIKEVEVLDEGTILVSASSLADMLNRMPDGMVKTNARGVLTISNKGSRLSKAGIIANYAEIPSTSPTGTCVIAYEQLKRALQQVSHSTKKSSANLSATGVHITNKGESLIIEACCDTSASRYIIENAQINGTIDCIVPADNIASKLSGNKTYSNDSAVTIQSSERYTVFSIDDDMIIAVNIAAKYFDIDRIYNLPFKAELTLKTADMKDMTKDAICIINSSTKSRIVLRLNISNNGTMVSYEIASETSNASGKLPCQCSIDNFDDMTIGINPLFIKEVLNFFDEDITIKVNNATSPLLLTNIISDVESSKFLILPVRLR